jgi:hypothetical protein
MRAGPSARSQGRGCGCANAPAASSRGFKFSSRHRVCVQGYYLKGERTCVSEGIFQIGCSGRAGLRHLEQLGLHRDLVSILAGDRADDAAEANLRVMTAAADVQPNNVACVQQTGGEERQPMAGNVPNNNGMVGPSLGTVEDRKGAGNVLKWSTALSATLEAGG